MPYLERMVLFVVKKDLKRAIIKKRVGDFMRILLIINDFFLQRTHYFFEGGHPMNIEFALLNSVHVSAAL